MNFSDNGFMKATGNLHAILNRAWHYHCPEVVAHFAATFGLQEREAIELFDELKLFLVATARSSDVAPQPERIRAALSVFVQFSDPYNEFCESVLGTRIPLRPNGDTSTRHPRASAATEYFWSLPV